MVTKEDIENARTFRELSRLAYQTSVEKGWHQESEAYKKLAALNAVIKSDVIAEVLASMNAAGAQGVPVMTKLGLITAEVAEAMEEYRNTKPGDDLKMYRVSADGKLTGFGSELADIIIRTWDLAESLGIDLDVQIHQKMAFNLTRSQRHGGKNA